MEVWNIKEAGVSWGKILGRQELHKERGKEGKDREKKERKQWWERGIEETNALVKVWSSPLCKSLKYIKF